MNDSVISVDSEDLKVHATSRNRKRMIRETNGTGVSKLNRISSLNSNDVASKRRRMGSSSADEDELVHKPSISRGQQGSSKNGSAETSIGSRMGKAVKKESETDNDVIILGGSAGVSNSTQQEDPWSRLEEYSVLLGNEFPDLDPLAVQDALVQNEVSLMKARRTLRQLTGATGDDSDDEILELLKEPSKRSKKSKKHAEDEGDEIDAKYHLIPGTVYDSDDSDCEEETQDRTEIMKFLQAASLNDLMKLRGLSERKAKHLIEARPFVTWKQTVHIIKAAKYLNLDSILEAATDYLNSRATVSKIIHRCQKLADKIEDGLSGTHTGENAVPPPKMLSKGMKLQSYQVEALQWLSLLHKNDMNGILADEMGLGKTIQSIAFIAHLIEHGIRGPFLIVAPASTIDNWDDEFRRWTPSIRTVVYHGSLEDRAFLRHEYFSPKGLQKMEVVITTYDGVTRNVIDKAAFKRLQFKYAIFDEAHLLKNMTTQKYRTLMNVIHSDARLLLTGTPVQNNLTELLSLLVFAMPQMLSRETASLEHAFTYISKEGGITPYEAQQVAEARAILKPFILRRTKEDVALEIPSRTATAETVIMSSSQKELYEDMVRRYSKEVKQPNGIVSDAPEYKDSGLAALHQLRKLANHPLLIRNIFDDDMLPDLARDLVRFHPQYKNDTAKDLVHDLEYMSDFQLHQLCSIDKNLRKYKIQSDPVLDSGKFEYFDNYLPQLKEEDHRVLIFSQYVQMLDIVESYLTIRKHKYARIDGSTPVGERQDIVDRFNRDDKIFVMLLSTRAGGLGINLTGADTVIIHDIDFNPYNDKQAENRCHRLGQKKEVSVYRLISKGTIEEQIYDLGQKKLELEKNVMEETKVTSLDPEELDPVTARALLERTFSGEDS